MFLAKNLFAAASMIAALGLAGCASSQKKEASNPPPQQQQLTPAQQAQQQAESDRATFVNQTQTRIDQLSKYSADLRNRSAAIPKPQNKKVENSADDMDSLLTDAKKSLTEVKSAAPENWIDYKRDVEKSMNRAENEYSNTMHFLQ